MITKRSATRYVGRTRTCDRSPARMRTFASGFTLMELLIVMAVVLVLTVVAIPNITHMKIQANETAAIQSLRSIAESESRYEANYPAHGFACSLATLGGSAKAGPAGPQAAQVLPGDLSTGRKSGYIFTIVQCTQGGSRSQDQFTSYEVTAVPQTVGGTGHRGFCIDQTGEIKADPAGGSHCTTSLE